MNGIPNCVPEYYRSMQDDYDHEWQKEMERLSWYKKNKLYRRQRYIEGCDELPFYPDTCLNCNYGKIAPPDSEMDDIPTMICSNWKGCSVFINAVKESFPDVPFEEYCKWHEDYVARLLNGDEDK